MERFAPLLLDVWREACRHIEIGESLERIAPILMRKLSVDVVLVRRIDLSRACVETAAAEGAAAGPGGVGARNELSARELERLLAWCRRAGVSRGGADHWDAAAPGVVPANLAGEVLAGPLGDDSGATGVLVLATRAPKHFRDEHEAVLRALLEPFSAALDNDRRLREMSTLRQAAEADRLSLLSRLGRSDLGETIVGAEGGLRPVMERVDLVAALDVPVLILGETGSGKEVVARAIHARSRRERGPFLRVNCGAIPAGLIDSELFGHERGSFTGATSDRRGWFERAHGGTLFLDEIGELPPEAQVRLLRVLQDGTLERVGGHRQLQVDVRIVAATHRDLESMLADGQFREDLWYRIAVFPIHLSPLRDRSSDVPALAQHFAIRAAKRFGLAPLLPTAADLDLLVRYPWPGNVRELMAVLERAVILGDGRSLDVARALGPLPGPRNAALPPPPAAPLRDTAEAPLGGPERGGLDAAMAQHIETALARTHGRIEGPDGVAALLEINPHTLRARMRKLGVDWRRFRRPRAQPAAQSRR